MNELHRKMMKGLERLAELLTAKEINFGIYPPTFEDKAGRTVSDVPFISAVAVDASQVVYDGKREYDAWTPDGRHMRSYGMTMEQAAKLVATEYFMAKAARIKQRDPSVNIDELMKKLEAGYQQKLPVIIMRTRYDS